MDIVIKLMSTWFNVSTWGCPCRKGVLPQTWASGGGCSGWSGREWSFQRVPTLPAAICGTWSVENIHCKPFDAFPSCQVYSRNENYLQDILTVTVEKYLQGDKERDFVEKWMLSPNIIDGLTHRPLCNASSDVIVHKTTHREEIVLLYISLICVVVALS